MENPRTRGFDHYYGLKDGACNYFNPGNQRFGEGMPAQKKHDRIWCIEDKEYAPYTPSDPDFYTTDYFTKYALNWLDQYRDDERPFFLYMAYTAPHDPLMAWPGDIAKYKGKYAKGYGSIRKARYEKQKKLGIIDDRYVLSEATYDGWNTLTPEEKAAEERKMEVYAAMIDRLDQNIGFIFKKLKEQDKFDNTLIIFVSDNGASAEVVELSESYGEIGSMTNWTSLGENWANVCNTPLRYYKNYSYEGGIASPLIISWKNGLQKPDRNSGFVGHFIDIMATFVDLTKSPYPICFNDNKILPYEGESLMPVIYNQKTERKKPLYWEWQHGQAVRDGKWKLVKHGLDNSWSLFNMYVDPSETEDLALNNPEIVRRMDQMFNEWKQRVSIVVSDAK
jgi:arylsulfatase